MSCLAVIATGCARHLPPAERVSVTNVKALHAAFGGGATETSAPGAAPVLAEPTGWATLKGTFKLSGSAPERRLLNVDKDQAICAPGGKTPASEELVVDSASGGIRDVIIYMTGPAKFPVGNEKWEHPDYASDREKSLDFDQKSCIFLTHALAMRSTQKLRVINSDPVGHNTKIDATGRAAQMNATIPANDSTPYAPGGESAEPFPVSCSIHPWMSAKMIVRDSPYFAITKLDGSFEIKNVPAGVPLEFRVWQEKSKFLQDVKVNGNPEKWNRGRMKITLQPDEQKELNVVVDASVFK